VTIVVTRPPRQRCALEIARRADKVGEGPPRDTGTSLLHPHHRLRAPRCASMQGGGGLRQCVRRGGVHGTPLESHQRPSRGRALEEGSCAGSPFPRQEEGRRASPPRCVLVALRCETLGMQLGWVQGADVAGHADICVHARRSLQRLHTMTRSPREAMEPTKETPTKRPLQVRCMQGRPPSSVLIYMHMQMSRMLQNGFGTARQPGRRPHEDRAMWARTGQLQCPCHHVPVAGLGAQLVEAAADEAGPSNAGGRRRRRIAGI
jgi:hypothetical protein